MKDPFETNFTKAQAANENLAESSRDVYSAIASLQRELQQGHPSLPANLDEAAEEYSDNILANNEDLQDAIEDAFKEGAKWMVEHGETEVELEKEIERIVKDEERFMKFQVKEQLIKYVARHFAEWGATHLNNKEKSK